MGFRDMSLKSAYKSSEDDVLSAFYIPCLSLAVKYDRLTGFFSSSSFSLVAEGLLSFVEQKGHMRLICSPELQSNDIEVLRKSPEELDSIVSERMVRAMEHADASELQRDHLMVLAYMLAQGLLEVKLAVPTGHPTVLPSTIDITSVGMFHEKIGILEDVRGDVVSFSGSINESATAWLENAEDFKVFRSWVSEQEAYQAPDRRHFCDLWDNTAEGVRVMSLPDAVRLDMLTRAPMELDIQFLRTKYESPRPSRVVEPQGPPELYNYQKDAVHAWVQADRRGIFEMATGTGKTFTALACVFSAAETAKPLFVAIAVPQQHLASQWKTELGKFRPTQPTIEVDAANPDWRKEVFRSFNSLSQGIGGLTIVIGTYASLSSPDFTRILERVAPNITCFLLADEVHRAGASRYRQALNPRYELRLGLSATPTRWFDEEGTATVTEYFDKIVFQFPLEKALQEINPRTHHTFLVGFDYYPYRTILSDRERHEYIALTMQIRKIMLAAGENPSQALDLLLFKRARIVKDAVGKIPVLETILDTLPSQFSRTIIYLTEKQMEPVAATLRARRVTYHRFTMSEGTRPSTEFNGTSERDYLLRKLADGTLRVLLAIKCLDEGVDIPPARIAILMASSSSPVEHIQRLGRILRPFANKDHATIYDIIVDSGVRPDSDEGRYIVSLEKKERQRFGEIAVLARNGGYALSELG
jgi:superfamily II DNA or RNA helicase